LIEIRVIQKETFVIYYIIYKDDNNVTSLTMYLLKWCTIEQWV